MQKGFETALYNAEFLARENCLLRAESSKAREKKQRSRRQISPIQGLNFAETRDLISQRNGQLNIEEEPPADSAAVNTGAPKRRPPKCSNCGVLGHNRTKCPLPANI